jgi:hypothetical protein
MSQSNANNSEKLPRGITRQHNNPNRFRVRIYKNNRPMHGGYYDTLDEAIKALAALREQEPIDHSLILKQLATRPWTNLSFV